MPLKPATHADARATSKLVAKQSGGTQPNVKRFLFWFKGAAFERRSGSKVCPVSIILQTTFRNRSATLRRARAWPRLRSAWQIARLAAETAEALQPVVAKDSILVTDAARCFPPHAALYRSAGQRVRATCHIQTVGNRKGRFKAFLSGFRGVATKYLGNYLLWFQLARLGETASPLSCLGAAINALCMRFAK